MKILLVGFAKIKYMPYLNLYLENIDTDKNDVHLIYWNRDLMPEDTECIKNVTLHEFRCFQKDDVSKFFKIKNFLKFKRYAKQLFKENFDFVIVMQSVPCVLLADELLKNFKNRYIFDYRDFTYENIKLYKKIICSLVKNSYKTFVSSEGFKAIMPESTGKVLTVHNIISGELSCEGEYEFSKVSSQRIRIAFWGLIREKELNLQMIKTISEDERFELHYYGREQNVADELKSFVKKNSIENVFFHGEYSPCDKKYFALNTNIIHNIYNDKTAHASVSNKYYDSIIFKRPQICMPDTFMGNMTKDNGVGICVDPYSSVFTQQIYDYWNNLSCDDFNSACKKEIARVEKENAVIYEIINSLNK